MGCVSSTPDNKPTENGKGECGPGESKTDESETRESPNQSVIRRPPPIPEPQRDSQLHYDEVKLVRAVYSYSARESSDLSVCVGEILEIMDDSDSGWWYAKKRMTGEEGWIPSNFMASAKSLGARDWYFGDINRTEAEQLLLKANNKRGTYLVRKTETKGYHVLSLLSEDVDIQQGFRDYDSRVKHYKVRHNKDGEGFYIAAHRTFDTLEKLVSFYQRTDMGLACRLQYPCRRFNKPTILDLSSNMRDKWEIPRSTLTMKNKLGEGQFGEVQLAVWHDNVKVAVKSMKTGLLDSDSKTSFLKEAELMKKLNHKQLVRLYAVCTEEEPFLIVTEFMSNGCLLEFLRDNTFHLPQLVTFAAQVASGMAYLEANKYIHRDLAARNILVGQDLAAKVADFGMAKFVPDEIYYASGDKFPYKWTAPEALEHEKFTHKSDVWSFGVLLYEIFSHGAKPYVGVPNERMVQHLKMGKRLKQPDLKATGTLLPNELYENCMLVCWHMKPEKRPTFAHLRDFLEECPSVIADAFHENIEVESPDAFEAVPKSALAKKPSYTEVEISDKDVFISEGITYKVLYDLDAGDPNTDLTIRQGEILHIIDASSGEHDWWTAQNAYGEQGQVPSNFLTLADQ